MFDYDSFTKSSGSSKPAPSLNLLPENARVTCREYRRLRDRGEPHQLLDVRPAHHFQIASIPRSLNIPLTRSRTWRRSCRCSGPLWTKRRRRRRAVGGIILCTSSAGVATAPRPPSASSIREHGFLYASDLVGSLEAWAGEADPNFLVYW
ncbi:hypothetical protein C2845_PM16G04850 [Panicum miliaceum]|uniref:Rhodanese domain-containing protein n=1 Tax=Panicum miliaceum TaxID=4540 RepID=A0A3L6PVU9_PANMI|nr:hypothetical protein C2845_PM16G04850 [Panicum miliaceum]